MVMIMSKKRIAFVVQRYGENIVGGSEAYCRLVAEQLIREYNVEVLTTCAKDHVTWKNEYPAGDFDINSVIVKRFPVDRVRDQSEFDQITKEVFLNREDARVCERELEWMYKQGPVSSRLLEYIAKHKKEYDAFIFMTYLYHTTFFGLQKVPEKSILVSTAHDEPPIYLSMFYPFFHLPRAFLYLTDEEKAFVNRTFNNHYIESEVVGVGIEIPKNLTGSESNSALSVDAPYIIYVGRIEEAKGCKELFDCFIKYKNENHNDLKLLLVGKSVMGIPSHPDIKYLGFLSEEDKYKAISQAEVLVLPSQFESLSIAVLEALGLGVPILVNEKCEVLKGHCIKSNAGLFYANSEEFKECLNFLLTEEKIALKMGVNGLQYVKENYTWEKVLGKYKRVIDKISNE